MVQSQEYPSPSDDEISELEAEFEKFLSESGTNATFNDVCEYLTKHAELIAKLRKGSVYVPVPHFSASLNLLFDVVTGICNIKNSK